MFSILTEVCSECNEQTCLCAEQYSSIERNDDVHGLESLSLSSTKNTVFSSQDSRITAVNHDGQSLESINDSSQSFNSSLNSESLFDSISVVNNCMPNSPLLAHKNMFDLGLRGKGLHIGHLNIQGLRSGEKTEQIKIILQSKDNNICMLGLSESKLGSDVPDNFLFIENYQCFRKDKVCGAGGLLVYVRNDVVCNQRKDLETDNFESIWLEVQPKNSKSFLVGHFYRNPKSSVEWNETFEDQIEKVISEDNFPLG